MHSIDDGCRIMAKGHKEGTWGTVVLSHIETKEENIVFCFVGGCWDNVLIAPYNKKYLGKTEDFPGQISALDLLNYDLSNIPGTFYQPEILMKFDTSKYATGGLVDIDGKKIAPDNKD